MPSRARLATLGLLGLSLASCSRISPIVIFNATDHPIKIIHGKESTEIPPRGFVADMIYRELDLQNHLGASAQIDPSDLPLGKQASHGALTSVIIDAKIPFKKNRP